MPAGFWGRNLEVGRGRQGNALSPGKGARGNQVAVGEIEVAVLSSPIEPRGWSLQGGDSEI